MDITSEEITRALRQMPNDRSPGIDRLPYEFYKVFWCKIKDFFFEVVKEIIKDAEIHLSARRGILPLLEKLDKNPLKLESWKPLTLLTTDSKLFTKVLATRLQETQQELIKQALLRIDYYLQT